MITNTVVEAKQDLELALFSLDNVEKDIADIEIERSEAKENVKDAQKRLKQVTGATRAYAPLVAKGVAKLNQVCPGWSRSVNWLVADDEPESFFNPVAKIDTKFDVDGDEILGLLWDTAMTIHRGKQSVTVDRLLRRAGV